MDQWSDEWSRRGQRESSEPENGNTSPDNYWVKGTKEEKQRSDEEQPGATN